MRWTHDRRHGLVMRCDPALLRLMPDRAACDGHAVLNAFKFLADDWLCDVPADHHSKCVMIAYALSIIERLLFPARPVFLFTAGQRAVGKTTALQMLVTAVTGSSPPAAAWADNNRSARRRSLPICAKGCQPSYGIMCRAAISLASNELNRACSFATYSDRILGVSEFGVAPAYTIHVFTGNNVEPTGDLASRSLEARLAVDRADPQNRPVNRHDPVEWTRADRGAILQALYTILLGNPQLDTVWERAGDDV